MTGILVSAVAIPISGAGPDQVREVMTAETQKALTPEQVLADLKAGNQRFVGGKLTPRDYLAQVEATASGQYPKAIVLSCLDSRVIPEVVFDQGVGDLFVGREAGNVEDVNMLGSMEFATAAAGVKLIVVLGHSSCGAIKGAADGVQLANLTDLLGEFDGVLAKVRASHEGPCDSSDAAFIELVVEESVRQTMADILVRSPVISDLVESGDVGIAGGVYDLSTGQVKWLEIQGEGFRNQPPGRDGAGGVVEGCSTSDDTRLPERRDK
jgi:carbonic anhydrase